MFEKILTSMNLPAPIKEHQFNPDRKWRFDYAWPGQMVALEIEGGVWMKGKGAHSRPQGIVRDIEKYNSATVLGWRIIRVQPADLIKTKTLDLIKTILTKNTNG